VIADLRPFDRAFGAYIASKSGSAELGALLARVSAADGEGHAALPLDRGTAAELLALYGRGDPLWIGNGEALSFAVAQGDLLFLWRNWQHELAIADAVLGRLRHAPLSADSVASAVARISGPISAEQRAAIAAAPGRALFLLTGGPGTGKTTTACALVQLLLDLAPQLGWPDAPRVLLAAPTGKAAQRLGEAIGRPAQTLHSLLKFRPDLARFAHCASEPLAAELVLIDEASMLDLPLMRALLEALPERAMLVLLGDPDQLQSVAAGTVLGDLVAALEGSGAVQRLHRGFRSDRSLLPIIEAVRCGADALPSAPLKFCGSARAPLPGLIEWAHGQRWHERGNWSPERAFSSLADAQILCALRVGPSGSERLGAALDQHFRARHGIDPWYPGRAVMFIRNDPGSGLTNGELGIAVEIDGALKVATAATETARSPVAPDAQALRLRDPAELPEHVPAFALTVHKSQGSEYQRIALVLPPAPDHPLLTRQLLYTALTRARQSIDLWGDEASLLAAMARPAVRFGGLRARLERSDRRASRP